MKVVNLTSSELSALKKASSPVIDDYIKWPGVKGGVGDKFVQA
jgi:C4-dicarboxylate-binding protein DctP